jgi:hypothetical protein
LLAKRVDPLELRHVLLGVWCHSAAFADTLAGDTRLPRGISNDGWWPWVSDRSATLCTHAGQSIQGTDVPQLVAFAQACGFSRVASENQSEVPESPDNKLIQQVHGAWLISLASEAVQATKLKPLWTALQYWSDQSSGAPLELPGSLPEWIDFRSYWKSILSQWSSGAMAPAIELLELTEDGRDHLEHLRRALR